MTDVNTSTRKDAAAILRRARGESLQSKAGHDDSNGLNNKEPVKEDGEVVDSSDDGEPGQNGQQNDHQNGTNGSADDAHTSLPRLHTTPVVSNAHAGTSSTLPTQTKQIPSPSSPSKTSRFELSELSPIDPLSQHILKRTNTQKSIATKLRPHPSPDAEPGPSDVRPLTHHDETSGPSKAEHPAGSSSIKDKKKGVSFLSRIIGNKKKDSQSESNDDVSELGEHRAAGMDAEVFGQPIGHIPRYPPPPNYIKVRSRYAKQKSFNRLFVAQQLEGYPADPCAYPGETDEPGEPGEPGTTSGSKAIWAAEFSKDGKYLAVAGQDKLVRIWALISNAEDRNAHEIEEEARNDRPLVRLSAPVFKTQPVRIFEGHTGSIVDLSWSKNNFLLTTSMDKTVRLWHVTRDECLCCFKHGDFVTSIEFHPRDDRFFLAGALDCKLRLWSIPDKTVAYRVTVPGMVTAVAFTPDGKHSIAGCLNGLCVIYDTDGLKPLSQLHVRSARGRNAKGSKITGIDTIKQPPDSENGAIKLLVTSNDSRIRLYDFRDRTLEAKFRGNENATSQIRATFSDDGRYVICGSEDRKVYIWPINGHEKASDRRPVEFFEAHSSIVTTAIMAPVKSKQILGSTKDLLYDLCNPPPVTLVSTSASMASKQTDQGKGNEEDKSLANTQTLQPDVKNGRKPEESAAYVARSAHPDGNILITADYTGHLKVFRQDCGYHKRRHELWDTNSTFTRKILGRTNSISTRHSIASIGKDSLHKTPSERILSWRNAVTGAPDNASVDNLRTQGSRTRSASPTTSFRRKRRSGASRFNSSQSSISPSRQASRQQTQTSPQPPPQPSYQNVDLLQPVSEKPSKPSSPFNGPVTSSDATPLTDNDNRSSPHPPYLEGDQSYMFWNKTQSEARAHAQAHARRPSFLDPNGDPNTARRRHSAISSLTSENPSDDEDEDYDEEELSCPHCRGTNFRATRLKNGEQRLICVKCGTAATS